MKPSKYNYRTDFGPDDGKTGYEGLSLKISDEEVARINASHGAAASAPQAQAKPKLDASLSRLIPSSVSHKKTTAKKPGSTRPAFASSAPSSGNAASPPASEDSSTPVADSPQPTRSSEVDAASVPQKRKQPTLADWMAIPEPEYNPPKWPNKKQKKALKEQREAPRQITQYNPYDPSYATDWGTYLNTEKFFQSDIEWHDGLGLVEEKRSRSRHLEFVPSEYYSDEDDGDLGMEIGLPKKENTSIAVQEKFNAAQASLAQSERDRKNQKAYMSAAPQGKKALLEGIVAAIEAKDPALRQARAKADRKAEEEAAQIAEENATQKVKADAAQRSEEELARQRAEVEAARKAKENATQLADREDDRVEEDSTALEARRATTVPAAFVEDEPENEPESTETMLKSREAERTVMPPPASPMPQYATYAGQSNSGGMNVGPPKPESSRPISQTVYRGAPVMYNLPKASPSDPPEKNPPTKITHVPGKQKSNKFKNRSKPKPEQALNRGFGARLLAKQGWETGKGLGATGDGITTAISVQAAKRKKLSDAEGGGYATPANIGYIVGGERAASASTNLDPSADLSPVIKITGMLTGIDVEKDIAEEGLYQEIGDEMGQYGAVERVFVWRAALDHRAGNEVFIKFTSPLSALNAIKGVDGSEFAGNVLHCAYWSEEKFETECYA